MTPAEAGPLRRCTKCGEDKPLSGFYLDHHPSKGRPRYQTECRACCNARRSAQRPGSDAPAKPPMPTAEELAAWYRDGCRIA